jgi:hypothetical protein
VTRRGGTSGEQGAEGSLMFAIFKHRMYSADLVSTSVRRLTDEKPRTWKTGPRYLLFLLMAAPLASGRPADVVLPHRSAAPSGERKVIPRRVEGQPLRREIFQAIQSALAKRGIPARGNLRLEDLKVQSVVPALRDDLGLQVERIGFDPIRRETVFELWASNEPQYLPFQVTTRQDPQSLGLAPLPAFIDSRFRGNDKPGEAAAPWKESPNGNFGQGLKRPWSQASVLAKPGRLATLVILGKNVRITTTVVPLQPGNKGQCIRVRDLNSARILTGEVVGEGQLRASF